MLYHVDSFELYKSLFESFQNNGKILKNYQIVDLQKIKKDILDGKVFIYSNDNAFFVLSLKYSFFNLSIYTNSYQTLKNDFFECFSSLKSSKDSKLSKWDKENFSLSLCYKGDLTDSDFISQLKTIGFKINKKLARFTISCKKQNSYLDFVPEKFRKVDFAEESDADSIMVLLKDNFDLIGDYVPEYSDLVDNIRKKQVVCIRDQDNDNKVVAFHYFKVINNIYFGLFDCTDLNYRKYFLQFAISEFMKNLEHKFKRCYAWRDVNATRLNKFAKQNQQNEDGVIICNLDYKAM